MYDERSVQPVGVLHTQMPMVSCCIVLSELELVQLRATRLYRTLRDAWHAILPVGVILANAMPMNARAIMVFGEVIMDSNSCFYL